MYLMCDWLSGSWLAGVPAVVIGAVVAPTVGGLKSAVKNGSNGTASQFVGVKDDSFVTSWSR